MSSPEYFCPRCEAAVAKWNFTAPPDYYRCWRCTLATPFKDLPSRDLLRTWTPAPRSTTPQVIAKGTVFGADLDANSIISSVSCDPGSTLVVATMAEAGGSAPTPTSVTWAGLTETVADVAVESNAANNTKLAVYGFKGVPGGSGAITVAWSPSVDNILVQAIEITNRASLDVSSGDVGNSVNASSGATSSLTESSEIAVGTMFVRVGSSDVINTSWLNGFTDLQRVSTVLLAGVIFTLATSWKLVSGTAPQTAAKTLPASRVWGMICTTYKT